jgi:hypothetical protein
MHLEKRILITGGAGLLGLHHHLHTLHTLHSL